MPSLVLRFPGGRYHATPWGHHVNEGLVEWPPSPWRLVRALLACGHATQGWNGVPAAARRLVETLAGTLPRYRLPPASLAHSRHYMPTSGAGNPTLVLDTWAHVGGGALVVRWDCELDREAADVFQALAGCLGYLGRSESWVLSEAVSDSSDVMEGVDAFPHDGTPRPGPSWEQVLLVAPELPNVYADWRARSVADALRGFPLPGGKLRSSKKLEEERREAVLSYPEDVVDCLQKDTSWWKGYRWNRPPGSRRVLYWRRSDALAVGPPMCRASVEPSSVTTMLLALTPLGSSLSALPPCTRTLPQAELIHRALVSRAANGGRVACPELTGRDPLGKRLEGHRHAHVLPVDLDGDGHIDHIVIHAPMGLGTRAQDAIRSLPRTWAKGIGELRVALAGQGGLEDLLRLPPPLSTGFATILGPSTVWRSLTPLVPPRHLKRRGANAFEGQVLAELESRGLPAAGVMALPWDDETRRLRHFARVRRHPALRPPVDAGFAVELRFREIVRGPIALGYGSHFGLGLFGAVT